MDLDELETESFGGELLSFGVGAVATAGEEVFTTNKRVALTGKEMVARDFDGFDTEFFELA